MNKSKRLIDICESLKPGRNTKLVMDTLMSIGFTKDEVTYGVLSEGGFNNPHQKSFLNKAKQILLSYNADGNVEENRKFWDGIDGLSVEVVEAALEEQGVI